MKKQTILTLGICALAFGAVAGAVSAQRALETKAAAPENIYVAFGAGSAWKEWGATAAKTKVHFWGASGDLTTWPGAAVTEVTVADASYFKIAVPSGATGMIVTVWDGESKQNKTEDLTVPTDGKNLFTVTSKNDTAAQTGTWSTLDTSSETTPDPVEAVYYLAGSFNEWGKAVGKDEWKLTKNGDKYEITGVNLKKNALLKVTDGSDWFPEDNVSIAEDGKYTITLDGEKVTATKTGEYDGEITEVEYFLVGSFNEWKTKDATYKFTKMGEKKDDKDQYKLGDVELKKDDLLKVNDSEGVWYPGGEGGNYTVSEGGTYDIYFVPEGGITDWTDNGYFYLAKQDSGDVDADVPGAEGYYLLGNESFAGEGKAWKFAGGKKMFSPEGESTDLAVLKGVTIAIGDAVKARSYLSETDTWYTAGNEEGYSFANVDENGNYVFTKAGTYDFYLNNEGKLYVTGEGAGPIAEDGYIWLSTGDYGDGFDFYLYTWTEADVDKGTSFTENAAFPGKKVSEITGAAVSDGLNFNNAGGIWKVPATVLYENFIVTAVKGLGTEDEVKHQTGDLKSEANVYVNVTLEAEATADKETAKQALVAYEIASVVNSATDKSVCKADAEKATKAVKDYDGLGVDTKLVDAATLWTYAGAEISEDVEKKANITLDNIVEQLRNLDGGTTARNVHGVVKDNSALFITISILATGSVAAGAMLFFSRKRKANK